MPRHIMAEWIYSALRKLERLAAYGQGKGYGSGTVRQEVAAISKLLQRPPTLAVDIGGHSGTYTRELKARFPELEVHVFEPATANLARLHSRYGGDPLVTIRPSAVAGKNGTATLYSEKPGSGLASLSRRRLDHWGIVFDCEQTVETIRFEDYWREQLGGRAIDIVKMDIEGHELAALAAFGPAIDSVQVLQFEFGGTNIDSRTYFQDFFYFFADHGFDIHRITPFGLEKISRYREHDEFFFTINYLAVNRRTA